MPTESITTARPTISPVYVMTGDGTNAASEKETFDIIIDAQK